MDRFFREPGQARDHCRPYGPEWMPSDFPEDIPVTIDEQVQKAVDCYNAGATVLHVHVRELDGKGSKRLSKFNELLERLRVAVPDMVLQVGGSISFAPESEGAAAKWLSDDTRHMLAELDPKPDQVTVTVNTSQMNVVEQMCEADLAGTSLAEPANYNAYRDGRSRRLAGPRARQAPDRCRHPERVPVLQHQLLRNRRAHDPPRRLQGPAGDELGGHRRRHGRAQHLQPGQLRARARWRHAHARAACCCTLPVNMMAIAMGARALRHRGQPLDAEPQGQDELGEADRAAGAHSREFGRPVGPARRRADSRDRHVLQQHRRNAGQERLCAESTAQISEGGVTVIDPTVLIVPGLRDRVDDHWAACRRGGNR